MTHFGSSNTKYGKEINKGMLNKERLFNVLGDVGCKVLKIDDDGCHMLMPNVKL